MKRIITSMLLLTSSVMICNLYSQTIISFTTDNGLPHNCVNCIAIDADDNAWMGTQSGVAMYDGTDWTYFTTDDGLLHNTIICVTVDSQGNVWAGTDYGLCKYNGSVWSSYTTSDGMASNWVKYIAEDADGNIWVGTMAGVSKFNGTDTWDNYGITEGMPSGACFITFDDQGNKWFGTFMSGMVKYDDSDFTAYTTTEGLLDDFNILSIAIDDQNYKWVATSQGISVFDNSNAWSANYLMADGLFTEAVKDIDIDSGGDLWIATYTDYLNEGAVNKFNGTDWEYFMVDEDQAIDSLISITIRRLAIDSEDNVWVATGNGVSKIINSGVGIQDNDHQQDFILYPNPASDHFIITPGEDGIVRIYDVAMNNVSVFKNKGEKQVSISVEGFAPGVYFVKTGNATKKLMIMR